MLLLHLGYAAHTTLPSSVCFRSSVFYASLCHLFEDCLPTMSGDSESWSECVLLDYQLENPLVEFGMPPLWLNHASAPTSFKDIEQLAHSSDSWGPLCQSQEELFCDQSAWVIQIIISAFGWDISDTFTVMSLNHSGRCSKEYFAVKLTFIRRSTPQIFNTLSEMWCWILYSTIDQDFLSFYVF